MRKNIVLLSLTFLVFNSCIIKSLQPFYTPKSISFNKSVLGGWTDNKKGEWSVVSIKDKMEEDKDDLSELSEEEREIYNLYKEGYYINYIKNDKEAAFIAMPFKIKEQYFLDFIPIEIEQEEINSLASEHLLKTHSVAKLDVNSEKVMVLTWLSEKRISNLFEAEKIRLKHEYVGFDQDLLLTASSEELYAFLKKYTTKNLFDYKDKKDNKWKSSDKLTLKRTNANP